MSDSTMLIRKKGVCTNPDCDMCMTRTVQEIEPGEDFICADCGVPLKEVSGKDKSNHGKPSTGGGKGKLIGIIAGAAVVLGGGGAWFLLGGDKSADKDNCDIESMSFTTTSIEIAPQGTETATLAIEPADHNETLAWTSSNEAVATVDSEGKVTGVAPGKATITVKSDRSGKDASVDVNVSGQTTPPGVVTGGGSNGGGSNGGGSNGGGTTTGKVTLNYGIYDGPIKAGKPEGMGGEFKFTSAMTLDLKDGYGTTVELAPGDIIRSTKFSDGKLRQGEILFKNGSRKYITGLNQAL